LHLQSRSAFSFLGLFFSSQKSSSISKFKKAFEAIRKNKRDCKETLKRYSFRKPKREASPSEQVGLIFISNFEEELQKDDLQQEQQMPLHQEEPTHEWIPKKVHIPNEKHMKRISQQAIGAHLCGKKL
jgi:hypothetical protein